MWVYFIISIHSAQHLFIIHVGTTQAVLCLDPSFVYVLAFSVLCVCVLGNFPLNIHSSLSLVADACDPVSPQTLEPSSRWW